MLNMFVLVRVSIAMKRQHDPGKAYKGRHLIQSDLYSQRFSPLSWREARWHSGRHSAREGAENPTS